MLARCILFLSVATASATLELTPDNWQAEVTDSGKSAFIKWRAASGSHTSSLLDARLQCSRPALTRSGPHLLVPQVLRPVVRPLQEDET